MIMSLSVTTLSCGPCPQQTLSSDTILAHSLLQHSISANFSLLLGKRIAFNFSYPPICHMTSLLTFCCRSSTKLIISCFRTMTLAACTIIFVVSLLRYNFKCLKLKRFQNTKWVYNQFCTLALYGIMQKFAERVAISAHSTTPTPTPTRAIEVIPRQAERHADILATIRARMSVSVSFAYFCTSVKNYKIGISG